MHFDGCRGYEGRTPSDLLSDYHETMCEMKLETTSLAEMITPFIYIISVIINSCNVQHISVIAVVVLILLYLLCKK